MHSQSIATLKQMFANKELSQAHIDKLKNDERKGVQILIKTFEKQQNKIKKQRKDFVNMTYYERKNDVDGHQLIAGVDEAGRGPLAGPIVAAAVILPKHFELLGLNDSKSLNEMTRHAFYKTIKKEAICYGIGIINNRKIDKVNIYEATKLAMQQAIHQLDPKPDHVLVDAMELYGLPSTSESIVKGDQKSITIAAASILAKVTRDRLMDDIHYEFPVYDFIANKGYGTKHHLAMLRKHGVTTYHRKSYAPVRNAMK